MGPPWPPNAGPDKIRKPRCSPRGASSFKRLGDSHDKSDARNGACGGCAESAAITQIEVRFWHLTEVSILGVVRPLYGAKPTFVRAALQLAALKLEAKHHPTALPVGGWYCHASLVAYACCGGERTGFGYSRI